MRAYRRTVRADRLLAILLHLQARGGATAAELAAELEVSVRTIYRDIDALGRAGIPVYTESGPGGGCRLLDGYRAPLVGLSAEEAKALLILGVPEPVRELGLTMPLVDAQTRVRAAAGLSVNATTPLVHLDMPRWFHSREAVPHLPLLADAVGRNQRVLVGYVHGDGAAARRQTIEPLGLVNKAGVWYVVARTTSGSHRVLRVTRIVTARAVDRAFDRPADFDLAVFWDTWSAEFEATRPRLAVAVRASPTALTILPEIFGDAVLPALAESKPDGDAGWRTVTLTFEHDRAAATRLVGLGDLVEVISPAAVRDRVIATARGVLRRYGAAPRS